MERNVMGELNMYRQLGTRPNFSEIARRYGLDRHTVAKYWSGGEEPEDRRSDRASTFDAFADVIGEKAALPGVTKKAIHEFLLDRHPDAGLAGYNAFTQWCRAHSVECGRGAAAKANLELLESLARVADFELATPFRVYFCDPHSPWERPSNENTNGLIR